MDHSSIVGFWKFIKNRIRLEDGSWHTETLTGGAMAFSQSGDTVLFVRSEQGEWGFSGAYTFDGKQLTISIQASVAQDIEGTKLTRQIEFLNQNEFLYRGTESHTGRSFEAHFFRA